MWWPTSNDPFWLANQGDNQARQQYYAVSGTPTIEVDGSAVSWPYMAGGIQSRLPVPSPLWLDLSLSVVGTDLDVLCRAVANTTISGNYVIHIMVLDRYSYLPASPNGQPNHYHALLKIAPTAAGQPFSAAPNDTTEYSATIHLSASWDPANIDVGCFVQNNDSKEVLQAHCEPVPADYPSLYLISSDLEDLGNGDGRAEAGESANLFVTLGNEEAYQTAINVEGTLTTTDPTLTITTGTAAFPNIPNGGSGVNADPFVFAVDPSAQPHESSLHLHVVADPQAIVMDVDIPIYIGWPAFLLVDDDAGGDFESYYQSAIENLGLSYEYWVVDESGTPPLNSDIGYGAVIWFTGYSDYDALNPEEQGVIQEYLQAAGGRLFLSGQNLAQGLSVSAPAFLSDVLHAEFGIANSGTKYLNGVSGNPVGDGLALNCNAGGQGSGSCTSPDGITALSPASSAFQYLSGGFSGALTCDEPSGSKLVYLAFPFEAISAQNGTNTQAEVLQSIVNYFGMVGIEPTSGTMPERFELLSAHPNPFNPSTTISYQLSANGLVSLQAYDTAGRMVQDLVHGWLGAGAHQVTFDGSDLPSGIYLCRLRTEQSNTISKLVLLK